VEVQKVEVPRERMEEQSEVVVGVDRMEVRAEGSREHGGGCGVAADGMGGGGAACPVLAREREELFAGHARGLASLSGTKNQRCKAKLLMELRTWGVGCWGNLFGCCLVAT
jgi:hypothetical protein